MSWMIVRMAARAAVVYGKDQIADYSEGSRFESETDQWDNPKWWDYLSAAASGYNGSYSEYVKAGAAMAKNVGQYNEDRENWDYRNAIGDAMNAYGGFGGYGAKSKVFKYGKKGLGYLPDRNEVEDVESTGTVGSDPATSEYPGFYYKPDLTTDLYTGKFDDVNRGTVVPSGNEWKTNPMYTSPSKSAGMDDENLAQGKMQGSLGKFSGMDIGSTVGGILDVMGGRGYNTRPQDPYWIEVEGGDTNAEGGSVKEGWIDKIFG